MCVCVVQLNSWLLGVILDWALFPRGRQPAPTPAAVEFPPCLLFLPNLVNDCLRADFMDEGGGSEEVQRQYPVLSVRSVLLGNVLPA